jgi:hypothetical protein
MEMCHVVADAAISISISAGVADLLGERQRVDKRTVSHRCTVSKQEFSGVRDL